MADAATPIDTRRGAARKAHRAGTHRLVEPGETLARVFPLLPVMGISRVANITGLDRIGVHVTQAVRPNSRTLAVSQGKGADLFAAKASAVMEAVEAYHADHITLPVKHARYSDLVREHRIADVAALSRPKASPYHPDLPLLWIEGWDLLQNESVWLPFELVDGNFTFPRPAGTGCFAATSNGLASGNHLLEAISHGICEVVERDATTLWGLGGKEAQDKTRIDPATVCDPVCQEVLAKFARADLAVGVWETTSDIGIPVFLCKILERDDRAPGNMETPGYGCHPSRPIALLRALTEAAQTRLAIIAGSRDDLARSGYEQLGNPLVTWTRAGIFESAVPRRRFYEGPGFESQTFEEDVSWLLECLRAAGMRRVVVVDLTKPELGLPVVRVVIPGLEMALINPETYALGRRARTVLDSRS